MLEYSKTILSKVSFDRRLFEKELKKAINMVGAEVEALKRWCYKTFSNSYLQILDKHFQTL